MINILPLPVKKNKFGQRVAEISITKYYRQIEEEILEAFKEAVTAENTEYEAEELVDIITCCVTRMDISDVSEKFHQNIIEHANYGEDLKNFSIRDWYLEISTKALEAYSEGNKLEYAREACRLAEIVTLCIARLENIGYDETARQKIYQAVNEKNQRRGYFNED